MSNPCATFGQHARLEGLFVHSKGEGFFPLYENDRNLVTEALPGNRVGQDVVFDQLERDSLLNIGDRVAGVLAQWTLRLRVKLDRQTWGSQDGAPMRGLAGDFETMPLKDIVVYLGNKRATGTLNLERASEKKQVILVDGAIIRTSSNLPHEYLGQYLINMGKLTEEDLEKAYRTQKETRVALGKILVMIGAVPEDVVQNALGMKFREALLNAWHWDSGDFTFDRAVPTKDDGLRLSIELLDVHREGEFRETAWQAIRGAFPTGSLRLELDETRLTGTPKPGSLDERLLPLIRRGLTIDQLVRETKTNEFFLYQRLYALYRQEAVKVGASSPEGDEDEPLEGVSVVGEEQSAGEIAQHAEMFLGAGNYADAEMLARRANELDPTARNVDLLRRAERALADHLRTTLSGSTPRLLIPSAKLKSMPLSAPEKYLLSRVDGTRDLKSLISVSPIQELEALKLFQRFVDAGWISFA